MPLVADTASVHDEWELDTGIGNRLVMLHRDELRFARFGKVLAVGEHALLDDLRLVLKYWPLLRGEFAIALLIELG